MPLTIPKPGELDYSPDFINKEFALRANAVVVRDKITGFVHSNGIANPIPIKNGEDYSALMPEELAAMTSVVIEEMPFTWVSFDLYVRRMYRPRHAALGIHNDNTQDVRVLVEGHSSRWVFDQPALLEQYPDGLLLEQGGEVTLDNRGPARRQVRHGVELDEGVNFRLSYLWSFV